jgi:transketolase
MRNALVQWLIEKAKTDSRIQLLTADLGYSVLEVFQNSCEEQFFNVGVAEQNMVGIAAGMATEELKPYTYSIGIFPTFRCAEQIRNDIDYHNLPVVTCTVGSGVAYGNLGYSHHAIQDLALMRTLPNMVIATPADPSEVVMILDWHYENPCPMYLRLHKAGEPNLNYSAPSMGPGVLRQVHSAEIFSSEVFSNKVCVLVIGFIAEQVAKLVADIAPSIPVYSVPLWGRPARSAFIEEIKSFDSIITVEDHVLEGGFGSYVMEAISFSGQRSRVTPLALDSNVVGKVAQEKTLLTPLFYKLKDMLLNLA